MNMTYERKCLICGALEHPERHTNGDIVMVDESLAYLCPYCKDRLQYLLGIKDDTIPEKASDEDKVSTKKNYLYAARDTNTGKLVSDITNPKRKYWDKEGNARKAIEYYNNSYANKDFPRRENKGKHGILEIVKFELVEVPLE